MLLAAGVGVTVFSERWDRAQLVRQAEAQAELMQTHDFRRAYQAFSAKHQPVFRGD